MIYRRIAFGAAVLAALAAAAAALFLPGAEPSLPAPTVSQIDCPSGFLGFHESASWYDGNNRIEIRAKEGCGDKMGQTYSLTDVTVTISSPHGIQAELRSSRGTFVLRTNQVLLESPHSPEGADCLGNPPTVWVNVASGELRMPGVRMDLSDSNPILCPKSKVAFR